MARGSKAIEPVAQIARSVDLLVRLKIEELKHDRTQREMIRFLASLGVPAGEIASLLCIRRTTVDPELSKARASNGTSRMPRSR
jgi:hypothetical protein